jgi:outer membrane protein assembly factor BamA
MTTSPRPFPRFRNLTALALLSSALFSLASPAMSQGARRIARIEFEGLHNLTPENVIAMTGLKVGDSFSVGSLDAAAQHLVDSGLFKNVGYRTRTAGAAVTIVFQVEEAKSNNSKVVFDNFIWFSDEELSAAVKRVLPSFEGSVPDTGNTTELIRQSLQDLLSAQKRPGTVEYSLTETGHVYRIGGISLPLCTLHFPGAHDVSEEKLGATMKSQTDPNYSRQAAAAFPRYGLYPLYYELGHLRASFDAPVAKPDTSGKCENGVDLTIAVTEGLVYSWASSQWSGNQVLTPTQLDAALGMKNGEVANGKKFDRGKHEVEKAYGKQGHILAHLNSEPQFDDSTRQVSFKISVSEGPQFHMGAVEFRGVSEADAAALKERWKLKTGEVYDTSYVDRFFREDAVMLLSRIYQERHLMEKNSAPVDIKSNADRKALTVNLVIEIKS